MTDEMVQELTSLQPHTAYVKSAWKGKIQTAEVEQVSRSHLIDISMIARQNAIDNGILRPRSVIEQEIRERQDNWRRRRGNEPPPPTHTGDNTQSSSGSAGNDYESPPTHYILEKTPETLNKPSLLELVPLRFFESEGKVLPEKEQRQYSTTFAQNTARFVNFELNVRNQLYTQQDQTYHMWVRLYNPNGDLLWEDQHAWVIEADCERTWNIWAWGNAEPGRHWACGIYRVVILMDGVKFAEGSFTITKPEESPPTHYILEKTPEEKPPGNTDVSLQRTGAPTPQPTEEKSMRAQPRNWAEDATSKPTLPWLGRLEFYESGKGLYIEPLKRRYSTHFPQQSARYINIEMWTWDLNKTNHTFHVVCRYYKPDGCLLGETQDDWVVWFNDMRPYHCAGLGWDDPGQWKCGTYRVEILIDGVKFTEGSFTIE